MRIVFAGMQSVFSSVVLRTLLAAGLRPVAVLLPASRQLNPEHVLPVQGGYPGATEATARLARVPLLQCGCVGAQAVLTQLRALRPDVIAVACFDQRFPPALLRLPRLGCVNLHPSLLPAYRGPAPLFWQLRAGESNTGVTLHVMSGDIDAGDIIAQQPTALPQGADAAGLNEHLARVGGVLLVQALASDRTEAWSGRPQDERASSTQGLPRAQDFCLSAAWGARRAYNFMRGTAEWGHAYVIGMADGTVRARGALAILPGAAIGAPCRADGTSMLVQFADGVVRVQAEGPSGAQPFPRRDDVG